jgi:adenosine/AMP kinase
VILGQTHFIKTVEDLHEAMVNTVPGIKFGISFCEASGPCLVRYSGTDSELIELAKHNALNLSAGHCFIVFLRDSYPINVLNSIKNVPEVCTIFCATQNPVEVIIAESEGGRGVLGVIDGFKSKGVENEADIEDRKALLRKIGYKA